MPVEMVVTEQDVERERGLLFEYYLENGLRDNDELHFFVKQYLGYDIPRVAICEDHVAPFDFVADLFFERVNTVLGWGSRTGGKTRNVSILNTLNMLFKGGCEITSCGAVLSQAEKAYEYNEEYMNSALISQRVVSLMRKKTELDNGSTLEVISGTFNGLNSPHPQKSMVDEVELMDWRVFQQALSMSMSKKGVKGQDVFTSTRKKLTGTMQRLINEADEKGIKIYSWCVWEVLENCDRDCDYCKVYGKCQGMAHKCSGYYPLNDFIKKASLMDWNTFRMEWLNQSVTEEELIYAGWITEDHVVEPFEIPKSWKIVSGVDFGSTLSNPFSYLKFAIKPGGKEVYCVWAYKYPKQGQTGDRTLKDHAKVIKSSSYYSNKEKIYRDPSGKQEGVELRDNGVKTITGDADVKVGIDRVRQLLEVKPTTDRPTLMFFKNVWREEINPEMMSYSWVKGPDGKPIAEKPLKLNDHYMDATRYALYTWFKYFVMGYAGGMVEEGDWYKAERKSVWGRR